jgi:hypothetical protein
MLRRLNDWLDAPGSELSVRIAGGIIIAVIIVGLIAGQAMAGTL